MAVKKPALFGGITIDSSNNGIRCYTSAAGWVTASIAAGTYYFNSTEAADDILPALKTACQAATSAGWRFYIVAMATGDFRIMVTHTGYDWAIDWDHADTTFDSELLGIADASAAFGAVEDAYDYSDYHHRCGWYASQPIEWDPEVGYELDAIESYSPSGKQHVLELSTARQLRPIRIASEPRYRAYPVNGYNNYDWQRFWQDCRDKPLQLHMDYVAEERETDERADYSAEWGYFPCVFTGDSRLRSMPNRRSHASALYSWDVNLAGYVA